MAGPRCIKFAGPERVRRLLAAPNVQVIRRRKDRAVVEIQLLAYGDDLRLPAQCGNPQMLSHRSETDENPRRVWTFKRLAVERAGSGAASSRSGKPLRTPAG